MTYSETIALCNNPEFGRRSWTAGRTETTLTATERIRLIEIKNLFKLQSSEVV